MSEGASKYTTVSRVQARDPEKGLVSYSVLSGIYPDKWFGQSYQVLFLSEEGFVSYSVLPDVVSIRRRVWSDTQSWVLFLPGERRPVNYSVLSRIVFTRRMVWSITPSCKVYFYPEKGLVSYSVLSGLFLSGEGFSQLLRPIMFISIRRRV